MSSEDNVRPFRRPGARLSVQMGKAGAGVSGVSNELLAALVSPACDVRLVKGDRSRRYWIREGRGVNEWYCQVWFGEKMQHRGDRVDGVIAAQRLLAQYRREIAELVRDGWEADGS